MTMSLADGLEPITDVDGPYGAVQFGANAVALRVWPESLGDSLAEFSLIVTNRTWNTLQVTVDDIRLVTRAGEQAVIGKSRMLARLEQPTDAAANGTSLDIDPMTEGARPRTSNAATEGSGSRRPVGEAGTLAIDPALSAATRSASSGRRPTGSAQDSASLENQRATIAEWYLDELEIYPGDTGTGGFSIPVPAGDADFQLHVRIGGDLYRFPVEYRTSR